MPMHHKSQRVQMLKHYMQQQANRQTEKKGGLECIIKDLMQCER